MVQNTSDNRFGTAKWIVDPSLANGTHSTIAAALTAATSGETIFIRPGTYTENLTLKAGVNLAAYECDSGYLFTTANVKIIGKATFAAAGTVTISGVYFQTNADYLLVVSGNAASIVTLKDCYINCANATGINLTSSSASSEIILYNCSGDVANTFAYFVHTGAGILNIVGSDLENSGASTAANTISSGFVSLVRSSLNSPITSSVTGIVSVWYSQMLLSATNTTALTLGANSGAAFSHFQSGTAAAVVITGELTASACNFSSSNVNVISGAGILNYADLTFTGTSSVVSVSTQNALPSRLGATICPSITTYNNGAFSLATGTGALNLGTDAVAKTCTLGNQTGASSTVIDSGTGALNIGTAIAKTITLGNGTGATSVVVDCGTGALNLGANAIARTTTLGNTTGASVLALKCGTGDFTLASATGTIINAIDTGEVVMPLQPAFFAYATAQNSVTGNGTNYQILFANEIFDQNADFNASTFTAPITGRYSLQYSVSYKTLSATATFGATRIVTSNRTFALNIASYGVVRTAAIAVDLYGLTGSCLCDMDAADTAYIQTYISGMGADNAGIDGGDERTFFSGFLAC